ncbi:MAG: hypothetical protein ABI637_01000 [Gemmatimonadota bacterium]
MFRTIRAFAFAILLSALAAARVSAQASPYVALDDPELPRFEHFVARGDVADPSPFIRPFLRADAVRVLALADTAPGSATGRLIHDLHERWTDITSESWYSIGARAGAQAYSHARRDALHPAGPRGARPYAEVPLMAAYGNLILVARPAVEPRVTDDPDWPGRPDVKVAGRLVDGYVSAQFKFARLVYGQLDQNWGPVGVAGIPLSNYGYERQGLGLEIGSRALKLSAFAEELRDGPDSSGQIVHRYYFVHRLTARLSDRVLLAAWEGNVIAGAGRNFETRYRNPVALGYLTNTIGLGDDRGNEMLGLDVHWRAFGRTTLEAQLALDDFYYQRRYENRDRYGLTLAAFGPLGTRMAWRGLYTQVSSLALRAFDRSENFTDAGVGLGRNFSDNDQLSLFATMPAGRHWLLTPELTLFRQGEGRINDPYPTFGSPELQSTPTLFIGTVERTYRAALGVSGREGPFDLTANAGFHHVVNSGHQAGVSLNRFEGRLQATIGLTRRGSLRTDE